MGLGKLPGEQERKVGCRDGPSSYVRSGFNIKVNVGEITKEEDVLGIYTDSPQIAAAISGYSGNKVIAIAYYQRGVPGVFQEVSAGTDLSDIRFCAVAKGR
jgi:hypothetical protein